MGMYADELKNKTIKRLETIRDLKIFDEEVTVVREELDEDNDFFCITVPKGAIVIQHNYFNSVTGNCHYEGMAKLFKVILKENLEFHTDELRDEIYDVARKMVDLEFQFIDLCFEMGGIEGLTADETKEYVKYICDRRLIGLGYKGIYKVKTNPLPWVEEMLNAVGHANFFERRSIDYARNAYSGSWGKFWKPVLKSHKYVDKVKTEDDDVSS